MKPRVKRLFDSNYEELSVKVNEFLQGRISYAVKWFKGNGGIWYVHIYYNDFEDIGKGK